jgi:surfactin synthase thioesterase subunit
MKDINLYCFPFAGGNKYSYREYEKNAPDYLQLIALEYPGRGTRIKDAFITNMQALVDNLYQEIKYELDKKDYALYGHSMGGIVAFYLVKRIIAENHNAPLHLFITGTPGPSSILREQKKRHRMGKKEFIQEIKDLDGCPDEILQNEELLNFFEPILRADFEVSETFTYVHGEPIDVPITVITGTEEEMKAEEIFLWQKETRYKVDFGKMPGNHFFILHHAAEIISIIASKLNKQSKTYQL